MASLSTACRLSSRLAARQLRHESFSRGYRTSAACLAAQNFTMPALSPTMTEGNIASWKVKEGDSFSAGDVLLEIETDKASMDVEAQDDGIIAKIIQGDGSKNIQVGSRIGVLAEPGDDLSSLEIPADDSAPAAAAEPKEKKAESASESEAPESSQPSGSPSPGPPPKPSSEKAKKQTYPLLPSVQHLVHEHGLAAKIDEMTPSGPNNRLLKGDVLAYLGSVAGAYPGELSARIGKLSHLDLSNIRVAAPPHAPAAPARTQAAAEAAASASEQQQQQETELEVALPVSMAAVLEVQRRIQASLGVFMPLSTFVARAAELANDDLPRSALARASPDELFNQVLGLDAVTAAAARGSFMPQIMALPSTAAATAPRPASAASSAPQMKSVDIIDILSGKGSSASRRAGEAPAAPRPRPGVAATTNVFSVSVKKGDEKRARVFLERVKSVLEGEPGRLVL